MKRFPVFILEGGPGSGNWGHGGLKGVWGGSSPGSGKSPSVDMKTIDAWIRQGIGGKPKAKAVVGEKNLQAKMRKVDNPYEIWQSSDGWEWRVLKKYQAPSKEAGNSYARWFCAVKSPFTFGGWEYGDVYVREIRGRARKVS